jgi:hypothetical protein
MTEKRVNRQIPETKYSQEKLEEAIRRLNRMDKDDKKLIAEMQEIRRLAGKEKYELPSKTKGEKK